jgi:protein-L-isoaspartate(D-aspartate) O-methyltransferase
MTTTTGTQPEDLRARMVDQVAAAGYLHSGHVELAMRTVPRHLFLPAATVEESYADQSVTTKPSSDGRPLSCASKPTVVAMMLEQLDARPGHRILEIGAGTGYNAALLAELVGETGDVTTVDIDPEATAQARQALDANGYGRVHVTTGDGALGEASHAPYDRIIVTVGPWDLPNADGNSERSATAPPAHISRNACASRSTHGTMTAPPSPSSPPTRQAPQTGNCPTGWSSTSDTSGW